MSIAADLVPLYEAAAKARQAATQVQAGKPPVSASLRSPDKGKAAEKAAQVTGASTRSVESVLAVTRAVAAPWAATRTWPSS